MIEPTDKEKVEALERILKSSARADEIRYKKFGKEGFLYVYIVNTDPDSFDLKGYDEGLDLTWDAETYVVNPPDEYKDVLEPLTDARIVAEIMVSEDPWEIIRKLESLLKEKKEVS